MMKKLFLFCLTAGLLYVLNACSPPVYLPNNLNTPLLQQRGELNATLQMSTGGLNVQGAFAATDQLAVMVNGAYNQTDTSSNDARHKFLEAGVGMYKRLGNIGITSMYGGYGHGETTRNYTLEKQPYGRYHRYFVQSAIGLRTGAFEAGAAARMSIVNMYHYENSTTIYEDGTFDLFLEPALFMRLGWENVKFHSQLGLCIPAQDPGIYEFQPIFFSIGMNFRLTP